MTNFVFIYIMSGIFLSICCMYMVRNKAELALNRILEIKPDVYDNLNLDFNIQNNPFVMFVFVLTVFLIPVIRWLTAFSFLLLVSDDDTWNKYKHIFKKNLTK